MWDAHHEPLNLLCADENPPHLPVHVFLVSRDKALFVEHMFGSAYVLFVELGVLAPSRTIRRCTRCTCILSGGLVGLALSVHV